MPAEQLKHIVEREEAENMPAVQLKQMEADVCEDLPAAHGMQAVAPAAFMYRPAAHELQTLRGILEIE